MNYSVTSLAVYFGGVHETHEVRGRKYSLFSGVSQSIVRIPTADGQVLTMTQTQACQY